MGNINAEIKKAEKVLSQNLRIPHYQRPYRWTAINVLQLLNDIYSNWKEGKQSYRIGSVILHSEPGLLNIVDGQQRLTTLLLLFNALKDNTGIVLLESLEYNHSDSANSIINNYKTIQTWANDNIRNEEDEFLNFVKLHCEFVEIKVDDLSEAFQVFDTQNGRGKELEAYNLLKAYHIRAMNVNTFEEKVVCDQNWENATRYFTPANKQSDLLKHLFEEQIFRTRKWSKKTLPGSFDKTKIEEFKGFTIDDNLEALFPYQNKDLLQFVMHRHLNLAGLNVNGIRSRFKSIYPKDINPFVQINQEIVNGKSFFEYIHTYSEIYKHLFELEDENVLHKFKAFYQKYCIGYIGAHRHGDRYLLELYKSLIFLMFDKFGEEGVDRYHKTLYAIVYRIRLEKMQVRYAFVDYYPQAELFHIIDQAKTFADLVSFHKWATNPIDCKKEVKEILHFFFNKKIPVTTNDKNIDLTKYVVTNGTD